MNHYFDYAATSPAIESSVKAYVEALKFKGSINRTYQIETLNTQITSLRTKLNELFNNDGIATFVSSATYSANLIAFSLANQTQGLNVYGSILDHHSLSAPWIRLHNQKQINYYHLPIAKNYDFDYCGITKLWEVKRPDVLNLTYVNNVIGYKINLSKICQLFRKFNPNGTIILDSSQYIGGIDLKTNQIDFCFFSTHKWYSVKGIGCLLISKHAANNFKPLFVGGGAIHKIENNNLYLRDLVAQIEIGTNNEPAILGFKAIIDNLDLANIRVQNKMHATYFLQKIKKNPQIEIYNHLTENQVALNLKNVHNHDFGFELQKKGFIIRTGNHCASELMEHLKINGCVRISFGLETTNSQIDSLIKVIEEIANKEINE